MKVVKIILQILAFAIWTIAAFMLWQYMLKPGFFQEDQLFNVDFGLGYFIPVVLLVVGFMLWIITEFIETELDEPSVSKRRRTRRLDN